MWLAHIYIYIYVCVYVYIYICVYIYMYIHRYKHGGNKTQIAKSLQQTSSKVLIQ